MRAKSETQNHVKRSPHVFGLGWFQKSSKFGAFSQLPCTVLLPAANFTNDFPERRGGSFPNIGFPVVPRLSLLFVLSADSDTSFVWV